MTQYVYFARCVGMRGPIKIGCSSAPWQRASALAAWAPFPVELLHEMPGSYLIERRVHAHFASLHSHREWFRADPVLLRAIERLKAGEPLEDVIDMNASGTIIPRHRRRRTEEERKQASDRMKAAWARKRATGEPWSFATTKRPNAHSPAAGGA